MEDYAAAIAKLSADTGREILAAPCGLEFGVVDVLKSAGIAVRCVTLNELQEIRCQHEVTVFRVC